MESYPVYCCEEESDTREKCRLLDNSQNTTECIKNKTMMTKHLMEYTKFSHEPNDEPLSKFNYIGSFTSPYTNATNSDKTQCPYLKNNLSIEINSSQSLFIRLAGSSSCLYQTLQMGFNNFTNTLSSNSSMIYHWSNYTGEMFTNSSSASSIVLLIISLLMCVNTSVADECVHARQTPHTITFKG